MPNLVVILGPHAVGKMTVGQELEELTGYSLFHNHMSIELARKIFPAWGSDFNGLVSKLRRDVFEAVAESGLPGMIFTYMFGFDEQSEFDYINDLISLFKSRGGECCVVELCADFVVRLERNKTENRLLNKESKRDIERSEAEMKATSAKYRLNSYDGEALPFENYIKLDNTSIPPEKAAQMICKRFDFLEKAKGVNP